MIRVLIVDDSPTVRLWLKELLEADSEIRVVGTAANGEEGVQKAVALKPDLITMDIRMPVMDGFEATRLIMQEAPTPIVVVSSSVEASELLITFNAIQAGALDVIEKPPGINQPDFELLRERLVTTVKLMAEVKVIRRHRPRAPAATRPLGPPLPMVRPRQPVGLLAMAASTGGPAALNTVLRMLPREFPLPIVVVQHMSSGFTEGLVKWLQTESRLTLNIAQHRQRVEPGQVYFAPDDNHLELAGRERVVLSQKPPVSHVRPSATVLFESAAHIYGAEAIGVLLTGMGDDGALGLKTLHDRGGATVAQDESTCVIYGMPKVAVGLGAADYILPIEQIAPALMALVQGQTTSRVGNNS